MQYWYILTSRYNKYHHIYDFVSMISRVCLCTMTSPSSSVCWHHPSSHHIIPRYSLCPTVGTNPQFPWSHSHHGGWKLMLLGLGMFWLNQKTFGWIHVRCNIYHSNDSTVTSYCYNMLISCGWNFLMISHVGRGEQFDHKIPQRHSKERVECLITGICLRERGTRQHKTVTA